MKRVILVRHGESEINAVWKEKAIFCGQIDTPLTEKGRRQALDVGRLLADTSQFRISHAVSSTLVRAVDTLQLIRQQLTTSPELRPAMPEFNERSLGLFEGRAKEDVYREFPEYESDPDYCNFRDHYQQKAPGGENLSEVTSRAWPALESMLELAEPDVLIVAHCQVIRCLIARAISLDANGIESLKIPHAVPIVLTQTGTRGFSLARNFESDARG
jgi:broad specificity phosphatase PhoE